MPVSRYMDINPNKADILFLNIIKHGFPWIFLFSFCILELKCVCILGLKGFHWTMESLGILGQQGADPVLLDSTLMVVLEA